MFIKNPKDDPKFSLETISISFNGPFFYKLPIKETRFLQILRPRPIPCLFYPASLSKV